MRPKIKLFILLALIIIELAILFIARVSYDREFINSLR
jgi:hypothetical protein